MEQEGENCPVKAYEAYIARLHPEENALFTKASMRSGIAKAKVWYTQKKLGKNTVGNLMKKISKEANLSQIYTNHCLRASTATILARAGLQNNEIAQVTGHKNVASLDHYINAPTIQKKAEYSSILHNKCGHEENPLKSAALESAHGSMSLAIQDVQGLYKVF